MTPRSIRKITGWSFAVWGLWFLAFVVLELLGLRKRSPWITLSETTWALEKRMTWIRLIILAGLAILVPHLVFGFPGNTPLG